MLELCSYQHSSRRQDSRVEREGVCVLVVCSACAGGAEYGVQYGVVSRD